MIILEISAFGTLLFEAASTSLNESENVSLTTIRHLWLRSSDSVMQQILSEFRAANVSD